MQRLRPLSEDECYARCYGDREDTVRVVIRRPESGELVPLPVDLGGAERDESRWWEEFPLLSLERESAA